MTRMQAQILFTLIFQMIPLPALARHRRISWPVAAGSCVERGVVVESRGDALGKTAGRQDDCFAPAELRSWVVRRK